MENNFQIERELRIKALEKELNILKNMESDSLNTLNWMCAVIFHTQLGQNALVVQELLVKCIHPKAYLNRRDYFLRNDLLEFEILINDQEVKFYLQENKGKFELCIGDYGFVPKPTSFEEYRLKNRTEKELLCEEKLNLMKAKKSKWFQRAKAQTQNKKYAEYLDYCTIRHIERYNCWVDRYNDSIELCKELVHHLAPELRTCYPKFDTPNWMQQRAQEFPISFHPITEYRPRKPTA